MAKCHLPKKPWMVFMYNEGKVDNENYRGCLVVNRGCQGCAFTKVAKLNPLGLKENDKVSLFVKPIPVEDGKIGKVWFNRILSPLECEGLEALVNGRVN